MRYDITLSKKDFDHELKYIHDWWVAKKPEKLQAEIDEILAEYCTEPNCIKRTEVGYSPPENLDDLKFLIGEEGMIDLYNAAHYSVIQKIYRTNSWIR